EAHGTQPEPTRPLKHSSRRTPKPQRARALNAPRPHAPRALTAPRPHALRPPVITGGLSGKERGQAATVRERSVPACVLRGKALSSTATLAAIVAASPTIWKATSRSEERR